MERNQKDSYHLQHWKKSIDLEERLEKNLNDVNSFSNANTAKKVLITYSKDENHRKKRET